MSADVRAIAALDKSGNGQLDRRTERIGESSSPNDSSFALGLTGETEAFFARLCKTHCEGYRSFSRRPSKLVDTWRWSICSTMHSLRDFLGKRRVDSPFDFVHQTRSEPAV